METELPEKICCELRRASILYKKTLIYSRIMKL